MGHRGGFFTVENLNDRVSECSGQPVVSARTVDAYTVSSQMGFEAILDSHKPRVLDQLFYAGWH